MIKSMTEKIEIIEQQAQWYREIGIPTARLHKQIIDLQEKIEIIKWESEV